MALRLKQKQWLAVVGCLAFVVPASLSFYRPLHVAFYAWKEPHFVIPVYVDDRTLILRHDQWGEGHFGARRKGGRMHRGIDIKADIGTVVYAAKSGYARSGSHPRGLGRYIVITHLDGSRSVYGHMKDWLIDSEGWVRQGQVIGLVGKSGNANLPALDPHLHFEIWKNGNAVDPLEGCFKQAYQVTGKVE